MRNPWLIVFGMGLGLTACGSTGAGSASGGTASGGTSTGGTASGGASTGGTASGGASTGGTGAGTVGTDPAPFESVAQLWIGAPDDPATTVVYAFSKPTACGLISAHGWDAHLAPGTQEVEMKEFGNGPGSYKVVTTKTPAPGEAAVNFSSNAKGAPVETSGDGGSVTLTAVNANKNATGSYSLKFGMTMIDGTFDAAYCAGGVEP